MLVKYLESLMGAADYEALVQAKDQQLCSISTALDSLHDEIDRCAPSGKDTVAAVSTVQHTWYPYCPVTTIRSLSCSCASQQCYHGVMLKACCIHTSNAPAAVLALPGPLDRQSCTC